VVAAGCQRRRSILQNIQSARQGKIIIVIYALYTNNNFENQGNQKERFSKLFRSLQEELYRWQSKYYKNQNIARDSRLNTREIVSKDEFTLVDPFTARLKALTEQRREDQDDTTMLYEYRAIDRMRNRPLCIEDIPVVSYDSFFQHFTHQKSLPHNNKTNNELVGSTQLSINV
jgi:hypothetical protein